MARPQRNNVDYFPLYVDNGRKMFFIEQKYGNDGYSTWLKILSELGKADYHYLNLKDETQLMYLSAICRVDIDTLNNIINDLVKLNEFNKILWNEKIIFSEKFVSSIEDAYNKRSNNPPSLDSLEILLKGLGIIKQGFSISKGVINPQTIVEDIKVKDIIVYLNGVLNSKYKSTSDKTKKLINARINEGFITTDFKKVIDIKFKEWNNTDYAKFLRPETLFGNKFESYLNQKEGDKTKREKTKYDIDKDVYKDIDPEDLKF